MYYTVSKAFSYTLMYIHFCVNSQYCYYYTYRKCKKKVNFAVLAIDILLIKKGMHIDFIVCIYMHYRKNLHISGFILLTF